MKLENVVTVENMRQSDAHTINSGIASAELMRRAAQGIFDAVKFTGRVAVICGKGNNGGDGYALACILCRNGITPTIFRAGSGFSEDGLYYYNIAKSLGANELPMSAATSFAGFDIVVDCLLGTGFRGELKGEMLGVVREINRTNAYVISADINSGINGNTGICTEAVNSDLTVSIGAYKSGMFLNDAPYYIGSLKNAEIGIELLKDEYKLINYDMLHMFEGYGSYVLTSEEFQQKYPEAAEVGIAAYADKISKARHAPVVIKTEHSALIADMKYIYFCADYIVG